MKKLMVMALGLGIALGSVSFAQDKMDKMDDSKKMDKKAKKHKKAKKDDASMPADKKM